jgi:hypothetical protein
MDTGYILEGTLIAIIAALICGWVVGHIILRIQGVRRPLNRSPYARQAAVLGEIPVTGSSETGPATASLDAEEKAEAESAPSLANLLASLPRTEFVLEIESNLSTARAPQKDNLIAFQTRILEAESSRADSSRPELQKALKAAYTDMRLANTLISLSSATGHKRPEIYDSYLGLCSRIEERLERLTLSLASSGRNAAPG